MNKKGFTLVEMLATVTLLGIISTIGIVGGVKYLNSSRKNAFKMLSQSIYEAAENCVIQGKCTAGTYNFDHLVTNGYLKNTKNPISSKEDCTGNVIISKNDNSYDYSYQVNLTCDGMYNGEEKISHWPQNSR